MDKKKIVDFTVTDTALSIIDSVIKKERLSDSNRADIVFAVCQDLEARYPGNLEASCQRVKLQTTRDVMHAIDIYFVMKELFPDTKFDFRSRKKAVEGA